MPEPTAAIELPRLMFGPDDANAFAAFQQYEADRFARKQRHADTGRPLGMRLSMSCPCCRVKAVFNPWYASPVDEGDGERGHFMESVVRAKLLHDHPHTAEAEIVWGNGQHKSAWDFLLHEGHDLLPTTLEVKSRLGSAAPAKAHIEQVARMAAADGLTDADVGFIVCHPGNLRAWLTVVPLGVDAVGAAREELAACIKAHDYLDQLAEPADADEFDADEWWQSMGVDQCSRCKQIVSVDGDAAMETAAWRLKMASAALGDAKTAYDAARASALERFEAMRERKALPVDVRVETFMPEYRFYKDARGVFRCDPVKEKQKGQEAAA